MRLLSAKRISPSDINIRIFIDRKQNFINQFKLLSCIMSNFRFAGTTSNGECLIQIMCSLPKS